MRKLAAIALAIVVGCSQAPQASDRAEQTWTWMQHEKLGTPMHLSAPRTEEPMLVAGVPADQATLTFLGRYKDLFKMRDAASELSLTKSEVDHLSMTHVRFQQVTHGIPVVGAELAAHYDATGRLASIDANYIAGIGDLDLEPKIASNGGRLVVYAWGGLPATLAYEYTVRAVYGDEPAIWVTTVNAMTGEVIERYNNLQTIEASGSGVLGDSKTFEATQSGGSYAMTDTSRGVSIKTYSAAGQQVGPGAGARAVTSTTLTSWDTGSGAGAAVDAHVYAGVVFDYYKKVHGRNAIDDAGGAMLSTAHFGQAYDNAFWDGTGMSYGDGGSLFKPLSASLDVVAHEFTHGVTEKTSGLAYKGQSGALNESVSDIFGVFIEHSMTPDDTKNWTMGENIALSAGLLRDFKNPAAGQQPANMSAYVNTQQDNGGVHINSGIPNNAAYLMTMGGTNPVSKTVVPFGIGWEKSEKLWYRANTKYFMATTSFAQAAQGVMSAGKDIGLTENELNIVDCAWKATGVVQGACAAIAKPTSTSTAPTDPGTTVDPGSTSDDATSSTPDDPSASDGTTSTPKKKRTVGLSADNGGCAVGAHGRTDLGPLAGILAAVAGLALSRRKRRKRKC